MDGANIPSAFVAACDDYFSQERGQTILLVRGHIEFVVDNTQQAIAAFAMLLRCKFSEKPQEVSANDNAASAAQPPKRAPDRSLASHTAATSE